MVAERVGRDQERDAHGTDDAHDTGSDEKTCGMASTVLDIAPDRGEDTFLYAVAEVNWRSFVRRFRHCCVRGILRLVSGVLLERNFGEDTGPKAIGGA